MSSQGDAYPLPRATGETVAETQRLDGQHEMFKLALGSISVAQLPANISSVLDVGCGTGIWSCQFAELHPHAQILGVDIVPPVAASYGDRLVPKNCSFVQANVEEDWAFAADQKYDFIFGRLLIAGLKDWPQLFGRVYQHLSPGGMYELYEGIITLRAEDGTTSEDSALMRWYDELRGFVSPRGVDPDIPLKFTGLLQDCGFKVTYDRWIKMYIDPGVAASHDPVNGARVADQLSHDIHRMITNMTEKVLSSPAQRALAAEALEDMTQNSGPRGYYVYHTNKVAQKPL